MAAGAATGTVAAIAAGAPTGTVAAMAVGAATGAAAAASAFRLNHTPEGGGELCDLGWRNQPHSPHETRECTRGFQ